MGGHGLEFFEKDGEEFVIHVDCGWHFEAEGWNATPNNGRVTILIADGYATDFIFEMSIDGQLVRRWGGHKEGDPAHLQNAHGISIDMSNPDQPLVWVPSRAENKLKAFTLDGEYVETLDLPGAYAGQLFFKDDKVYTAICWSKENGTGKRQSESGFLVIMDRKSKKVLSAPGGNQPVYKNG